MQQRLIKKTGAGLIAVLLAIEPVILRADEPFPAVSPGGYLPNGQPQDGYNPGGYPRSVAPSQPVATFRPDSFPGGTAPQAGGAAPAYGPIFKAGQPPVPNGTIQAAYVGQAPLRGGLSVPAGGAVVRAPAAPPKLCEWSQILGRVGNDVVLASDVLIGIDDLMGRMKGRIPPEKFAEQRALLVEEVTAGVKELAAHYRDPDPVKAMSPTHAGLIHQLLRQQIDVKLIFQDFLKTVPKEALPGIQESVNRHFEETQIKNLMKRENVVSRADLETALQAKGSSLDRERRIFLEQVVAQQWIQQKVNPEKEGGKGDKEEITHEEMLTWYQAHIKDFEHPAKARWEELMISFAQHPNRDEAYAALAGLGNRVLAGATFADVARSASEGPTAREGGRREWTQKDSLNSENLNQALFSQPVAQLSPQILESADGFHIIRVVERQDLTHKSFLDAQKQIKESIQKERAEKRYKDFVEELRKKYPVWTIFDNALQQPKNPDDEDRYK